MQMQPLKILWQTAVPANILHKSSLHTLIKWMESYSEGTFPTTFLLPLQTECLPEGLLWKRQERKALWLFPAWNASKAFPPAINS